MKRMACVLALATGTGLGATLTQPAMSAPATMTAASGLDIAIVPPTIASGDSKIGLDVRFRHGAIETIELYLDGKLAARQPLHLHDRQGVITFDLDATQLSEGSHAILVKAFDLEGNTATATSRLRIAPDEFTGAARFLYPKNRMMVKGIVPLQVTVDSSISHPFVSFSIDGGFLALMNTPPYTYNWDSSKVDNGPHSVGFEVYDSVTNAKIKTVVMQINVNNPGGFTKIQPNTPDMAASAVAKPGKVATNALLTAAESALPGEPLSVETSRRAPAHSSERALNALGLRTAAPSPRYNVTAPHIGDAHALAPTNTPHAANLLAPGLAPHALSSATHLAKPLASVLDSALRAAPGVAPITHGLGALPPGQIAPDPHPSAPMAAPGIPGAFANPSDLAKLDAPDASTAHLALPTIAPRRAGNIAARPSLHWGGLAAPIQTAAPALRSVSAVSATVSASSNLAHTVRAAHRVASRHGGLFLGMHVRTFGVAFNKKPVVFDVAPRVENGLPLAPFRQIFEQTGGTVQWVNRSQTVRAVNATKDIEIRVGKKTAKVNNKPVTMDAKAYLDQGRTIVPLTFVRDALDVKVNYDAKTGRLLIESK